MPTSPHPRHGRRSRWCWPPAPARTWPSACIGPGAPPDPSRCPTRGGATPTRAGIWLPRPEQRPAWQAALGPCARPDALVTALETAHPALREAFVEERHAHFLDQIDDDPDDPRHRIDGADTLDHGWRAAVSYATALHTDTTDHPERGDPWHALDSFDSLHEHLLGLPGESDDILLSAMLHAGATAISEAGAIPVP